MKIEIQALPLVNENDSMSIELTIYFSSMTL